MQQKNVPLSWYSWANSAARIYLIPHDPIKKFAERMVLFRKVNST